MATHIIIDVILLAVLILFAVNGLRRGLIMSLFSLIAVLVAFVGALLVSNLLTPTVAQWIMPKVEEAVVAFLPADTAEAESGFTIIEEAEDVPTADGPAADAASEGDVTVDDIMENPALLEDISLENISLKDFTLADLPISLDEILADGDPMNELNEYLDEVGIELPSEVKAVLSQLDADEVREIAEGAEEDATIEEMAYALAEKAVRSVVRAVLFVLAFVLLLIVWKILARTLDLVSRLPVLNTLNKLGGLALGAVRGALILFVCAWLARLLFSQVIPADLVEQSTLLQFFLTVNPLEYLAKL